MAITIDWANKEIYVLKADTTLVDAGPPEIRELNIDDFRSDMNALQAAEEGIPFDTTHVHTAPLTVAGVTLGRVVEIINGYTVKFENLQYSVNIVGGNSNIGDVKVQNQVSVNTANTAGLVETDVLDLDDAIETGYTMREVLRLLAAAAAGKLSGAGTSTVTIRDINDTKDRITASVSAGNRTSVSKDAS